MLTIGVVYCTIENVPVNESRSHQLIKEQHGEEVANQLTYVYEVVMPNEPVRDSV